MSNYPPGYNEPEDLDHYLDRIEEENKRLHAELEKFLGDGSDYSRLALIKEIDKREQELIVMRDELEQYRAALEKIAKGARSSAVLTEIAKQVLGEK